MPPYAARLCCVQEPKKEINGTELTEGEGRARQAPDSALTWGESQGRPRKGNKGFPGRRNSRGKDFQARSSLCVCSIMHAGQVSEHLGVHLKFGAHSRPQRVVVLHTTLHTHKHTTCVELWHVETDLKLRVYDLVWLIEEG